MGSLNKSSLSVVVIRDFNKKQDLRLSGGVPEVLYPVGPGSGWKPWRTLDTRDSEKLCSTSCRPCIDKPQAT
jgi:hypothetical protein